MRWRCGTFIGLYKINGREMSNGIIIGEKGDVIALIFLLLYAMILISILKKTKIND